MSQNTSDTRPRRHFLRTVMAVVGTAPLAPQQLAVAGMAALTAGSAGSATAADALPPVGVPILVGYECFSADEAAFVENMVNVMCPADRYTPNGVDCGLAIFIDRQLAGAFGQGAGRYLSGPWQASKPQMGLQLPLTPQQFFSAGVAAANRQCQAQFGKPFDQLTPADADAFLNDLSHGKVKDDALTLAPWFNELMYPLFEQACFSDPLYGGNHDKVFWKMVGYPGLPATHTLDMLNFRGKPYPGAQDPKSIVDFS